MNSIWKLWVNHGHPMISGQELNGFVDIVAVNFVSVNFNFLVLLK